MYQVNCPSCGQIHDLHQSDLGVNLICASCGEGFIYDEPLKEQKRQNRLKAKAERAKRKKEREAKRRESAERRSSENAIIQQVKIERRVREAEELAKRKQIEIQQDQYRLAHGGGCPRCGSVLLTQKTHTSSAGWGLFSAGVVLSVLGVIVGVLGAPLSLGVSLVSGLAPCCGLGFIFCLVGIFLNEKRAHCGKCKWSWKV